MCTRDGQKRQQQQQCNRLQTLHCQEYRHTRHCKLGGRHVFSHTATKRAWTRYSGSKEQKGSGHSQGKTQSQGAAHNADGCGE